MRLWWSTVRAVAGNDLAAWLRSPWLIAAALAPPLGMAAFIWVLTLAVGRQPVALVVEGDGPQTRRIVELFRDDAEAYVLKEMDAARARQALAAQQVAAVITIPADFDAALLRGQAVVQLDLNNIDLDFADDIRRTVTRTVGSFEAPILGLDAGDPFAQFAGPDPYLVTFQEHLLRETTVGFARYEVIPVLNKYIALFERLGLPIYASRDWHPEVTKHFKDYGGRWPPHCIQGTEGAEFAADLKLPENVEIMSKGMNPEEDAYSVFQAVNDKGVAFADSLRERGVRNLYIGGLATDYCVKSTALDALQRGFEVTLLLDAVRGVDVEPGDSRRAIEAMIRAGSRVATFKDVEEELMAEARQRGHSSGSIGT